MPKIFDNITEKLLPALQTTLGVSERADICVGYFNLRGWRHLAQNADRWAGGEGNCCRLLVGMHITPSEELRQALRTGEDDDSLDNQTASQGKRQIAQEFREQLIYGAPTNEDEIALRQLAQQIRDKKLIVKVYLRHTLHAKLYLSHRQDPINPIIGYLGSSNLTLAGLSNQGELNIDVLDSDATIKLSKWFQERWNDRWCLDISEDLANIIDESWARDKLIPPYHVYLKMVYHLTQEARLGLAEFQIPSVFGDTLFEFQTEAVKIAAHLLHKRGGVLIGDVVGLGKSIMATALAKIFEEDFHTETLIICPKNLEEMWEDYAHKYKLLAKVMSISTVIGELPEKTRRYRVVIIDESHNLRNKEGKRWRIIREYIERNGSKCILLSATPYNKTYLDLSAQLGLFLRENQDLGIRPENLISELGGENEFIRKYQCPVRSITAFEKSENINDWQDLMGLYMVRRTRGFILRHYAEEDKHGKYLSFNDEQKYYFPRRIPKTVSFKINEDNPADSYAKLFSDQVIEIIDSLTLPRYGLGNYISPTLDLPPTLMQQEMIKGLSRAGSRLMGFCRTNLFKRLESAGSTFLLSLEWHIQRNYNILYAIKNGLDIPIGPQTASLMDIRFYDEDINENEAEQYNSSDIFQESDYEIRAKDIYMKYKNELNNHFDWLPSGFFDLKLAQDLQEDAHKLIQVLNICGKWDPNQDNKLDALYSLIQNKNQDKILVFTQFADTARYLKEQLVARGCQKLEVATGDRMDVTSLAWRFSPKSNNKQDYEQAAGGLQVLIATDVLSEGQNLQDCSIIVNYDLPWAIIRLIQRAGRVDRIGQEAPEIQCYSFMPAEGIEQLIRLRDRLRRRLETNAEVIVSDEIFFDDEEKQKLLDLYHEKSGILDDDEGDTEVDLSSYAYQIWKDATKNDSLLADEVKALPNVVYATKARNDEQAEGGVLVYIRTSQGNDTLAWMDKDGNSVTQSQLAILNAAACTANTEALPRMEHHHVLTRKGLEHIVEEEKSFGGSLGRPTGARYKTYERLKSYRNNLGSSRDMFITDEQLNKIDKVLEDIYRYPLYQTSKDKLNRQIKAGISDNNLADLVLSLREEGRLCEVSDEERRKELQLICSMGLK